MWLVLLALTSSILTLICPSVEASAVPFAPTHRNELEAGVRVPVLYEAYYPETQKRMDPQDQLERLRELTRELLQQEELLQALSSGSSSQSRLDSPLEYVFPAAPTPSTTASTTTTTTQREPEQLLESLTLSESRSPADGGPPRARKTRHHHGRADWFIKRLAAAINRAD